MATRTSKHGTTYNVPTVKSTYLSKNEKALLLALTNRAIEQLGESIKASDSFDRHAMAAMHQLVELSGKLI